MSFIADRALGRLWTNCKNAFATALHYHDFLGDEENNVLSVDTVRNSVTECGDTGSRADGNNSHAEGNNSAALGQASHSEGLSSIAFGNYSHAEGELTYASGVHSHAEGDSSYATGASSHAEGVDTQANGDYSHAEGYQAISAGDYSHAEGNGSMSTGEASHAEGGGLDPLYPPSADGMFSHAEGCGSVATGDASHAEGGGAVIGSGNLSQPVGNSAIGYASHAEGGGVEANGDYSHAQNKGTTAYGESQTALGKFNQPDYSDECAVIVGNGSSDSDRSDALRIDWNGNVLIDGNVQDLDGNVLYVNPTQLNGKLSLSGGTMTGGISWNSAQRLYWKEGSYGDQFAIVPAFSGVNDSNLLKVQGAVGDINTTPALYDLMTISGMSGNVWVRGTLQSSTLIIKKTTVGTNTYADSNPKLMFQNADASQNVSLTYTDYDSVQGPASLTLNGNQGGEYFIAPNIKGTTAITCLGNFYRRSGATRGTTPSANQYASYEMQDTAGRRLTLFESGVLTNGQSIMNLWVLGHHTSSEQYGGIQIIKNVNNTNNAVLTFNANTGELSSPRSKQNLTQAQTFDSVTSGVTITDVWVAKWGEIMSIQIVFKYTSALAANANLTLGTLKSAYRPAYLVNLGSQILNGYLSNSGAVVVNNCSGASLSKDTARSVGSTYVCI